jgi:hypothetical protein
MIPDRDIWQAANLLIRDHGADAEIVAARRADEMLDRGDYDGQTVWLRIRRALVELQAAPVGKPISVVVHRETRCCPSTRPVSAISSRGGSGRRMGPCGHDGLIHPATRPSLGFRPDERITDLLPRLHCQECEQMANAIISIGWADRAAARLRSS